VEGHHRRHRTGARRCETLQRALGRIASADNPQEKRGTPVCSDRSGTGGDRVPQDQLRFYLLRGVHPNREGCDLPSERLARQHAGVGGSPNCPRPRHFVITNQRAVFSGTRTNRTWLWAKLISVNTEVHQGQVLAFLPVENRMKTSGVHLGTGRAPDVGLTRINLGIALATGRYDDHVAQIEADLRDVKADRPVPPQTIEGV